jgi:hypothetical protein
MSFSGLKGHLRARHGDGWARKENTGGDACFILLLLFTPQSALLISFHPNPCSPELTRSGGIEVLVTLLIFSPLLLGKILTPNQFHSVVHQLVGVLTGFE